MTDTTRADFEASCLRYWGDRCPDMEFKDDIYTGGRPALAWAFWQAATLAERERCAKEAEHWQTISATPGHACGQYIAAAIRLPLPPTATPQGNPND